MHRVSANLHSPKLNLRYSRNKQIDRSLSIPHNKVSSKRTFFGGRTFRGQWFRREGRSKEWFRGLTRRSTTLIRSCDSLKRVGALAVSRAWFVRPPCIMIADERRASRGLHARARGLVLRHVHGHVSESPERVGLWHVAALGPGTTPWEPRFIVLLYISPRTTFTPTGRYAPMNV